MDSDLLIFMQNVWFALVLWGELARGGAEVSLILHV